MSTLVVAIFVNKPSTFFRQAVDSALASQGVDFDLVVVFNNCSESDKAQLEASLDPLVANGSVKVILGGVGTLGVVRARAFQSLSHDFVAMLDSDDLVTPTRLQKQVAHLRENSRVGAVGSDLLLIDQEGARVGSRRLPRRVRAGTLLLKSPLATPSVMFRREAYLSAGGFSDLHYCEDFELWIRISRDWDITNLGEPLTLYRQHPGQISSVGRLSQAICRVNAIAFNLGLSGNPATSIEAALDKIRCMPLAIRLRLVPSFLSEAPIPRLTKLKFILRGLL